MAKNVTLTPPTELIKGGRGAKFWLRGYFGKGNLSFEWVPYAMNRNGSFIYSALFSQTFPLSLHKYMGGPLGPPKNL